MGTQLEQEVVALQATFKRHASVLDPNLIQQFQDHIYYYYKEYGRALPWRETTDPYHIFISEVMLQQTQARRVIDKYQQFLATFPTVASLANAPLSAILAVWHGLGYNRRAKYLHDAAKIIMEQHGGRVPKEPEQLQALPGIGQATAASIAAFAFNRPTVFIETNIRRVFIHLFFSDSEQVLDSSVRLLVEQTLDREHPREWYWALMDYGAMLAKTVPNPNRRSRHYTKQSQFEGSNRQLRGAILRLLLKKPHVRRAVLQKALGSDERLSPCLDQLEKEGFIVRTSAGYALKKT